MLMLMLKMKMKHFEMKSMRKEGENEGEDNNGVCFILVPPAPKEIDCFSFASISY